MVELNANIFCKYSNDNQTFTININQDHVSISICKEEDKEKVELFSISSSIFSKSDVKQNKKLEIMWHCRVASCHNKVVSN